MSQQPAAAPARAASARVRVGIIGFGARGQQIARLLPAVPGAELAGIADAYEGRLARAREIAGEKLVTTRDPRALLDRPDLDAVVIATPDHLHVPLARQAAAAGKHVYCESPALHTADDKPRLLEAFASGRVLFAGGSGAPASPLLLAARDIIARGTIGKPVLIRAVWDTAGALDAWQVPFPPDASPETIAFEAFDVSAGAFDSKRFFRWRCYWQYGSGLAGARVAPLVAAAHVLAGTNRFTRVVASAASRRWKDGREVPDVLAANIDYDAAGCSLQIACSLAGPEDRRDLAVVGTEGSLRIGENELAVIPEPQTEPYADLGDTWAKEYRDWFYMMHGLSPQGQVRGTPPLQQAGERFELPAATSTAAAPIADFVDAVRSSRQPRESLADAIAAAEVAIAVSTAAREGRAWTREA